MTKTNFKAGDRVRRTCVHQLAPSTCPEGYEFIVTHVEDCGFISSDRDEFSHCADFLELVSHNLEDQLSKARDLVQSLEKQIEDEKRPKVGDKYVCLQGYKVYEIVYIRGDRCCYVIYSPNGAETMGVTYTRNFATHRYTKITSH